MHQVDTAKGLIDRDRLTVKDIMREDDNSRAIATEWYLGDELVRRDVTVAVLRGIDLAGEQAAIA